MISRAVTRVLTVLSKPASFVVATPRRTGHVHCPAYRPDPLRQSRSRYGKRRLRMMRQVSASTIAAACAMAWHLTGSTPPVSAQAGLPDPNAGLDPAVFGKVSPFIPMQSVEAVHMGLVWKRNSDQPKILYHARFPEYVVNDIADPALTDLAIREWRVDDGGHSVQLVAARCAARLRSVPRARHGPIRRRLVPATHLRRLPDAAGPEPERADAHRREPDDGAAAAVRSLPSRCVQEHRQVPHRAARRERLRAESRRVCRERLLEGDVLQHLLQRPRDAGRRTRLRVRRSRQCRATTACTK